jgi:Mn-dependent DtxR family transcriptional regulator
MNQETIIATVSLNMFEKRLLGTLAILYETKGNSVDAFMPIAQIADLMAVSPSEIEKTGRLLRDANLVILAFPNLIVINHAGNEYVQKHRREALVMRQLLIDGVSV